MKYKILNFDSLKVAYAVDAVHPEIDVRVMVAVELDKHVNGAFGVVDEAEFYRS